MKYQLIWDQHSNAMPSNTPAAHYANMVQQSAPPALRTFYKDEKSFDVTVDDIALVVHGWVEPASGSYAANTYEPATVSINSICWPGSDLDIHMLLSRDVMQAIQGKVNDQVTP